MGQMKVLITGGTGSFGQAFVKRLLADKEVERVVVYSRDELKQSDMAKGFTDPRLRFFIGDVRDQPRLKRALHGIDTIVHAAALKQVPAAEYNPQECIKTNIGGAENVIEAAIDCGIKRVIALSTDKAVHPVNLYGATKLAAEKLFVAANNLSGADGPLFSVVRYGNVVGSRGSVIPYFRSLAARADCRSPIQRMTRFWITLDDGVDLGPKLPGPDARRRNLRPEVDGLQDRRSGHGHISGRRDSIRSVGIRPGEKLHEILIAPEEAQNTSRNMTTSS